MESKLSFYLSLVYYLSRHVFFNLDMLRRGFASVKRPAFKPKYDNWIGGKWVAPLSGKYLDNKSPLDGQVFTTFARSGAGDVLLATNAAAEAFKTWSKTSVTERSRILNKIADVIEANLEHLAICETIDNGKPIRETRAADLPLVVDHWRYFASVIRAEEGTHSVH